MLKSNIIDANTRKEEGDPLNFRVFNINETGSNYHPPILKDTTSSTKPLIYVLVSIMNSLFTYPPALEHMISETHQAYGDPLIPIVYICADTLQNITKPYLFSSTEQDPIKKYKEKWEKKYAATMDKLKDERGIINHDVVYWDTFKEIPEYHYIRAFTEVILKPNLTLESLQQAFPSTSLDILNSLLTEVQEKDLVEKIGIIAEGFTSKILIKLAKQEKGIQAKNAQLKKQLKQLKVLPEPAETDEKNTPLDKRKNDLRLATHEYLAEEFAVFLLLSYLKNASEVKAKLHLKALAPETNTAIKPMLSYPISATQSLEMTCTVFEEVSTLYKEYATALNLPFISQSLTFLDSLVPLRYRPPHVGLRLFLDTNSEGNIHSGEASSPPELISYSNPVLPSTLSSKNPTPSKHTFKFSGASTPVSESAVEEQLNIDIEKIMKRVVSIMDEHLVSGEQSAKIKYKGVTYLINVQGLAETRQHYVGENEVETQLITLKKRLQAAVYNVKKEGWEEETTFIYKKYIFLLEVKPTAPQTAPMDCNSYALTPTSF